MGLNVTLMLTSACGLRNAPIAIGRYYTCNCAELRGLLTEP